MGIARVNGILAVARAFGNYGLRHVIKADPDIFQRELGADDDYIVLGSDGLWDVLRNKDVADMVYSMRRQSLSASRMAEELVKQASAQGSMDNITCLVVHFRDYVARVTALRQSHCGMNGPLDDSGPCLSPNTSGAQIEVSGAPPGGSAVGSSGGKGPGSRAIGGEIGWVDPVVVSVGGLVNGAANSGGVDVLGMYPSSLPSSLKSNHIQLINGNAGALLKAVGSAAAAGPGEGGGYNRMVFLPTSTPTTPTHLHNYSGHGNRKGKSVTISANPIAGHGGYSSLVPTEGGHSVEGQTANNNMRINNSGGIRRESSGTSSQRQQQKQALHLSFDSHDRVGSGDRDSSQRGGGDMKIANKSQRNSANNGINGVNSGSDVGKSQGRQMLAVDINSNHQIMPRQQLSGNYSHYNGGLEKDAGPGGGGSNPYASVSLPITAPSPGAGSGASSSATASKHPLITLSINNATSNTNHVPADKVMSAISASNVSDSMMFSRRKENPLYF
eukprot:gene1280-1450_t